MPDMNAEFYRCCGFAVEVSGNRVELPDGTSGHRVACECCRTHFIVPGDVDAARQAIPVHFLREHGLSGRLEDWYP